MRLSSAAVVLAALVFSSPLHADPVLGQFDNFEDGTTEGWTVNFLGSGIHPAPPVNVFGGPEGPDDSFLLLTSLGGAGSGSRLTVGNDEQWAGDYLAAGIEAITMDVNNLGGTDLFLRLVFEDPMGGGPP